MNKRITRLGSAAMAVAVLFSMSVSAAELTEDAGSASVPIKLSSEAYGTETGGLIFSVTVPTSLPLSLASDGTVTTADDCWIINNSHGPVEVKSVTITAENGWALTEYDGERNFSSETVDSKELGFMLSFGDDKEYATDDSDNCEQQLLSEPDAHCHMTAVDDEEGNELEITYDAAVSPTSSALTNETIANVAFVIGWAD